MTKREKRRKETAEVFTPPKVVNMMLDKLPDESWEENKTFCDPAAGNGNILIEIFKRKVSLGHQPLNALKTLWGVDIMEDNVDEMKERFLKLIPKEYHNKAKQIMNKQFIYYDALKWDFIKWEPKDIEINNIQKLF